MSTSVVTTTFIITNNQTTYTPEQIWVSFAGTFTYTGTPQTAGETQLTSASWQSFQLSSLSTEVALPYFSGDSMQYTFALNGFNGRIYINYGPAALTAAPNPGSPGVSPYIVFETTVLGSNASNMDLSYVDGISAAADTMIRDAISGAALLATSVNPVATPAKIMANVASMTPAAAAISSNNTTVRVMSAAAAPGAYHNWTDLMTALQSSTATVPLNICSYTSPSANIPASYGVGGDLYGYSGAPALTTQLAGFDKKQDYTMGATFSADINPDSDATLTGFGIPQGTPGIIISGSATVSGAFNIYITQDNMNAGTGIYGNNPSYVVTPSNSQTQGAAYLTNGVTNDLSGRIVGDLMAGMVFGWAASSVNIVANATSTGTNLYGVTFSAETISGISTGELFFLLSLAAAQGTLPSWIGKALDSNSNHYDQYLYAISSYTYAYSSGFTDRLQGYGNPDTYWYTTNPPVIPGQPTQNYPLVGFVNLFLGALTQVFTVSATQPWQNTGIQAAANSKITIAYQSGKWTADPETNNGALYDANGCPNLPVSQSGYPLIGANMGELVARIGNNPVFLLGDGPVSIPAGQSGPLQLCINDDLNGLYGAGLTDNCGSVTVNITVA